MAESLRFLKERVRWRSAGRVASKTLSDPPVSARTLGESSHGDSMMQVSSLGSSKAEKQAKKLCGLEDEAWRPEDEFLPKPPPDSLFDANRSRPTEVRSLNSLPPLRGMSSPGPSPSQKQRQPAVTEPLAEEGTSPCAPRQPVPPEKSSEGTSSLQWRRRQLHLCGRQKPQQPPQQGAAEQQPQRQQHHHQPQHQQSCEFQEAKSFQLPARLQEHLASKQLQRQQAAQQTRWQNGPGSPGPSHRATCLSKATFDSFASDSSCGSMSSAESGNDLSNPSFSTDYPPEVNTPCSATTCRTTASLTERQLEVPQASIVLSVANEMNALVVSHYDSKLRKACRNSFSQLTDTLCCTLRPGQHPKTCLQAGIVFVLSDLSDFEQQLSLSVCKRLRDWSTTSAVFVVLLDSGVGNGATGANFFPIMKAQSRFLSRRVQDVIVNTQSHADLKLAVSMAVAKHAHQNPVVRDSHSENASFTVGSFVGAIEAKALRGRGAWGTVYACQHPDGKQNMVMKRVIDPRAFESVWQEGLLLSKLSHPNIVGLVGPGFIQSPRHLTMLLEDGGPNTLFRIIRDFDLDLKTVKSYQAQLADATHYLHSRHIAHRDLKPENIVAFNHSLKVIDFGAAVEGKMCHDMAGTMPFIAPEVFVCREHPYIPIPSDVWSLGVIFIEMLTGLGRFNRITRIGDDAFPCKDVRDKLIDFFSAPEHIVIEELKNYLDEMKNPDLSNLVIGMFQVDPCRRSTSGHVLKSRWLANPLQN